MPWEFFFPRHFETFKSHGKELPCPCSIIKKILWADILRLPPPVFVLNLYLHLDYHQLSKNLICP